MVQSTPNKTKRSSLRSKKHKDHNSHWFDEKLDTLGCSLVTYYTLVKIYKNTT